MSRPRSRSPRNGFPWEEPTFDPCQVVAELDGNPKEPRRYFREDLQPEGHRRDTFPSDRQLGHQRRPDDEGFYHRNVSPRDDVTGYDARRLSPHGNIGRDGDRRREGFREHFQSLGNRGRLPHSPPSLLRERFPQPPRSRSDHLQREPGMGWREEQGRGHGRFREPSPGIRSGDQRGGAGRERGRRNEQGPNRDRRRDELHPERSTPYKRQRRDMDEAAHPGFMRNEEDYGQRYSVDTPRDRCGGDFRGSSTQGETRPLRPVVIEHDHGIRDQESRNPPQWDQFDGGRHLDFKRQRSPRPQIATQERFRTPESQFNDGKNGRRSQFQDNRRDSDYIEPGRNPTPQNRPNIMRSGDQRGPMSLRGRGGPHPVRGRLNHVQTGRTEPFSGQPRLQQSSQGYQDRPREEQRPGFQPFREDSFNDLSEGKPKWTGEDRLQQWDHDRSMDRNLLREDLDPKMPRQREHGWNVRKSNETSGINEETLTIKVDMTRPADQNSSLCYSSDRQLSLDLVNVGRQRLDFLPMLEHSGTYRETAMHTGTFAQEIITLVHHVKEQYFRDEGVTLNERFSAPQQSGYSVDEVTELTLDERFSSNRDFSLDMDSLYNDDPLFATVGSLQGLNQQPVRGPGDLRHDLERRRQERLEAVKVTIPGGFMSQRPVAPASDLGLEESYETSQVDDDRFSTWQEEQTRRREGNMVPRRGAPYRQNTGALRRNNRFGPRGGPMRRQPNYSNNPAGPIW